MAEEIEVVEEESLGSNPFVSTVRRVLMAAKRERIRRVGVNGRFPRWYGWQHTVYGFSLVHGHNFFVICALF